MAPHPRSDLLVQFLRTFGGGGGGVLRKKRWLPMRELPVHFLNERTVSLVLP